MLAGKLCQLNIQLHPFGKSMSFSKLATSLLMMVLIVAANTFAFGQQLEHAGLKQHWFTHSGVGASGKLADWYLDVDENSGTTFFEIVGGDYSETISQYDLGPNGKPLGVDFGLEIANIKSEVVAARLKSEKGMDVEVTVKQYTLPKSTLYTQTDNGIVRSYDAETGKVRWTTNLGNNPTESLGVAGQGKYVAALKGGSVFCLDSATGAVLWSKRTKHGASAPPQVDDDEIYVPLLEGKVERFKVDQKGFGSDIYISGGRGSTTTRPGISPLSICFANYSGTVSVAARSSSRGMPGFELKAGGSVLGEPRYKDGTYFITSIDSYVYALSESRGSLIWENSTGFDISQAPILLGNHVFVINDLNQLSRFDAATGELSANWQEPRPGIGTYAGASRTKIFTVNDTGTLKVLDQESGAVTGSVAVGAVASILPNTKTDRIYLLNNSGTIRCYREIDSTRPFFHSGEFKEMKPEAKMEDKPMSPEPDDVDPFGDPLEGSGTKDDPFADPSEGSGTKGSGTKTEPPAGGDPFADPVEGSGTKTEPPADDSGDPFGGDDSEDPFGESEDAPADDDAGDGDDARR